MLGEAAVANGCGSTSKYEEVYLHAYDSPREARAGIGRFMKFYTFERPHQSLGYQTPDAFYRGLTSKAA